MKNTKKIAAMAAALTLAFFSTPNNITSNLDSLPTLVTASITAEAKTTTYNAVYPVGSPKITSLQGWRTLYGKKDYHNGIDFVSTTGDKRVFAAESGTVIEVIDKFRKDSDKKNVKVGYGNVIKIQMSDGRVAWYCHLDPFAITVKVGDKVNAGDLICTEYSCFGNSTGPHLHYEVRVSKNAKYGNVINVNPASKGGTMNYSKRIAKTETTDTLVNGKTYVLFAGGTDSTLCVTATGKTNMSDIKAAKYSKGKMQQWTAIGSGNSWKFKNVATGKVIDFCVTNVSNIKNGTNVHLYSVSTTKVLSATQTVKPIYVKSGKNTYYKFAVTGNTKYVLDFRGVATSASSTLQLWKDIGNLTEFFILREVK